MRKFIHVQNLADFIRTLNLSKFVLQFECTLSQVESMIPFFDSMQISFIPDICKFM